MYSYLKSSFCVSLLLNDEAYEVLCNVSVQQSSYFHSPAFYVSPLFMELAQRNVSSCLYFSCYI